MTEREFAKLAMERAFLYSTDAAEFANGIIKPDELTSVHTCVGYCKCDHCKRNILAITDDLSTNGWTYQGIHAFRRKSYSYSPLIHLFQETKRFLYGKDLLGYTINDVANSHSRIHTNPSTWNKPIEWTQILCNECFAKTYRRFLVNGAGKWKGFELSVSAVKEWGETPESVLYDLGVKHEGFAKRGSISEY